MSHVVRNLPWVAWGGLIGWLLAKAHRGWVVNLQRRRIQRLLAESAASRPGWPLHVIDATGHVPHIEQPDAFLDALSRAGATGGEPGRPRPG
jgi:hypothetical protein